MEAFKRILKRIFCLPPLWTVIVSLFGYGFVLAVAVFKIQNPILQYASYIASAYALIVTVTGLVYIHTAIGGVRKFVSDHPLMKKFRSTTVGEKYLTDVRFRAGVSLYQGFFINLVYIVMKLVSGILYRSTWCIRIKAMTAATGGGVCTIVIGMASYMIWRANKNLKKLDFNNSQT